jgi:hypothetical protein
MKIPVVVLMLLCTNAGRWLHTSSKNWKPGDSLSVKARLL